MAGLERMHGGLPLSELRALGIEPESVLDLSVNVNPYGPSHTLRVAIAGAPLERYPDPECARARAALSAAHDVAERRIAVGSGATELLWTLTRVLVREDAKVLIAEPAFGELRAAAKSLGCEVHAVTSPRERAHAVDFAALREAAQRLRPALLYLCNPTTPLGAPLAGGDIAALAVTLPDVAILLDESFLSLSDHAADAALGLPPNVLRVRSLTKDHGVPGLRIGYAIVPPGVARAVEAARPNWTIGAAAQAAIEAAAGEGAFVERGRMRLARDRAALVEDLRALGFAPFPSVAPYVALPVGDAAALRARLLARSRVLVRDCSSFGLPDVIRVAVRPAEERERLLLALQEERDAC